MGLRSKSSHFDLLATWGPVRQRRRSAYDDGVAIDAIYPAGCGIGGYRALGAGRYGINRSHRGGGVRVDGDDVRRSASGKTQWEVWRLVWRQWEGCVERRQEVALRRLRFARGPEFPWR